MTDGINRSCGAIIPEVKKGTNRQSVVILLHAGSVILLACAAQFESMPNIFGPDDPLIEPALNRAYCKPELLPNSFIFVLWGLDRCNVLDNDTPLLGFTKARKEMAMWNGFDGIRFTSAAEICGLGGKFSLQQKTDGWCGKFTSIAKIAGSSSRNC